MHRAQKSNHSFAISSIKVYYCDMTIDWNKTLEESFKQGKKECFATRLKFLRKNAHLTQHDMAKKLNIKQPQYARYENAVTMPRIDILKNIASVLDVAPEYLLYSEEIGFSYDDHNNYRTMTLTVPSNELIMEREEAIKSIQEAFENFDNLDLALLCQCKNAIAIKNQIENFKVENDIEGHRIDTVISTKPLKTIDE